MHNVATGHDYYHFLMPAAEMHPRIYMGERVVFDKSRAPEVGDDVVIACADGRIKVRLLVEINDGHFAVSTYASGTTEHIARASVAGMWPVAWREDADRYEVLADIESEGELARA